MDPIVIGLIMLVVLLLPEGGDLFVGILLFSIYFLWFSGAEPKEPEVTTVIQEVQVKPEVPFNEQSNPSMTKELCEKQGNVWMYNECIK